MPFTITSFLIAAGYVGLFAGVFAETGFLIGVILPGGETLVFTAGLLASMHYFNIWIAILITFLAAVFADSLEYAFGRKYGPRFFDREDSRFLKKEYVEHTRKFYERHGGKTIILARFLPFIRTLAPALAGMGNMDYSSFALYNIAGGAVWATGIGLGGYYLGKAMPNADQYLTLIVIGIAMASFIASWLAIWHHQRKAL